MAYKWQTVLWHMWQAVSLQRHFIYVRCGVHFFRKINLYTDNAGGAGLGCGCYLNGVWYFVQWPDQWTNSGILKNITFLEIIPIPLAVMLWKQNFRGRRIQFCTDAG